MSLHLLGVSHRTASAEARAASSLTPDQIRGLLEETAHREPDLEVVTLATCNRTEFYVAGTHAVERWTAVLAASCPAAPRSSREEGWYAFEGAQAFGHLLRVACGLDSQLLGDGQILGQLRRALTQAQQAGTLGGVLSPTLAAALRTGRRARKETSIGLGTPGIGPAVAARLETHGVPRDAAVLVLGAGDAGRLTLRALRKAGYHHLALANRTDAHALVLAAELGVATVPWAQVQEHLSRVAVVVAATGAPQPVLTAVPARRTAMLVVDAGFPAQVAAGVANSAVSVVSLTSLSCAADEASARRTEAVPAVEALIAAEVQSWQTQQGRADLESAIKALHAQARERTRQAAGALAARHDLHPEEVERLLLPSIKALLHDHVTQLRSLAPRTASPLS